MARFLKSICVGMLTALLGVSIYFLLYGFELEETVGLGLLFNLRGPWTPPSEVVVVSIDKRSADRLELPTDPEQWSREVHARLIDKLTATGAKIIVFDIFFKEARDAAQDHALADAIQRAGNVMLYAFLKREVLLLPEGDMSVERLLLPTPRIAETALAMAPFPLPKVPVKVSQFWTFRSSAGDIPTLSTVALQFHAMDSYRDFLTLLATVSPDDARHLPPSVDKILADQGLVKLVTDLRRIFHDQPDLGKALRKALERAPFSISNPEQRRKLARLIEMYDGAGQHYLNFYGPPRSVTTLSYSALLSDDDPFPEVRGKVVFVGFSEQLQPEQQDSYYTTFSQRDGLDIAGVEIAATAFANLLEEREINPLSPTAFIALIIAYALLVAALCMLLPTAFAIGSTLVVAGTYFALCYSVFKSANVWLPFVVPVFIQTPAALFIALIWRFRETSRERRRIRHAFGQFLPDKVVDQLARAGGPVHAHSDVTFGICLATDAEQYTRLAETLEPRALGELMNRYYEILFQPVRAHGGIISDVVGDAMLALWSAPRSEADLRRRACEAALDILRAVERFSHASGGSALPTRIGLHSGELMLGNVGAMDHFEYRAVGDIVNTATRIQNLNKRLGTRLLASYGCLQDLEHFVTRNLGAFRLPGKQQPVTLCELICRAEEGNATIDALCAQFAQGLSAYQAYAWQDARDIFLQLLLAFPNDGPSVFYARQCETYLDTPPPQPWDGIVSFECNP